MLMRVTSCLLAAWLLWPALAAAQAPVAEPLGGTYDTRRFTRQLTGTETCLACHGSYNPVVKRPDNPRHSLWVNSQLFLQSVHARLGCNACHTNIDSHGHRLAGIAPVRDRCAPCHVAEVELPAEAGESPREQDLARMVELAGLDMTLTVALNACLECHPEEYEQYKASVHGVSVLEHKDTDAPFCMDCHGIHYILPAEDKRSQTNPGNIPDTCLTCHDQADVKVRAGLTREVGATFEESFHGRRAMLGGITVAVCSNCHGTHAIYAATDPRSMVNQRSLAKTCGQCHEGAQLNFAAAFSHKSISRTEQLGLYILKQIYQWVIFLLIAQFVLFAALDILQVYRRRRQQRKGGSVHV